MALTHSTLALGTRKDAKRFHTGMADIGSTADVNVTGSGSPTLADIKKFFNATNDWLYIGGHFTTKLYNSDESINIFFESDKVKVEYNGVAHELKKGVEFLQTKPVAVLWGGCNIASSQPRIDTMRALFGNHVLIGWTDTTNLHVLNLMLGGDSKHPDSPKPTFLERIKDDPKNPVLIRDAWLKAAKSIDWHVPGYNDRFCVIDPDGTKRTVKDIT